MFNGSFRWNTVEVTFSEHRFWYIYIIWYSNCGGNKTQEMQVLAHEHLHKGRTCLFLPIPCKWLALAYVIFRGVNCHFFDWTDITNCLAIHRIAMKQSPILEICWKSYVNDLPIHITLSLYIYIYLSIYIYIYEHKKQRACYIVNHSTNSMSGGHEGGVTIYILSKALVLSMSIMFQTAPCSAQSARVTLLFCAGSKCTEVSMARARARLPMTKR
jgi:hypothetical protein